jgi:hypothetical protein
MYLELTPSHPVERVATGFAISFATAKPSHSGMTALGVVGVTLLSFGARKNEI